MDFISRVQTAVHRAKKMFGQYGVVWSILICQVGLTILTTIAAIQMAESEIKRTHADIFSSQLRSIELFLSKNYRTNSADFTKAQQAFQQYFRSVNGDFGISGPQLILHSTVAEIHPLGGRFSVEWGAPTPHIKFQTILDIDKRRFMVWITNPVDSARLATALPLLILATIVAVFFLIQVSLLSLLISRLNKPIKSLTEYLQEQGQGTQVDSSMDLPQVAERDLAALLEQLRQLQDRKEQALSNQRALIRDLSHELRTPLTALRSVGELVIGRPSEAHVTRDAIHSMLEEASHMQSLIEGLLTLSRATEMLPPQKNEIVDSAALIADCVTAMSPVAEERSQKLRASVQPSLLFSGSFTIARQALMNLILNALDHCPADCEIIVAARISTNEKQVHISVSDNGPGIHESEHEFIFQRFRRGNQAKRRVEGHGLGLAIAKAFVNSQGGLLTLKSELGKGSNFTMTYRRGKS